MTISDILKKNTVADRWTLGFYCDNSSSYCKTRNSL